MAGGSGKKGKKRQKNAQQSSQQNQDRPQTLPTEYDFTTLGATANPNSATPRGVSKIDFVRYVTIWSKKFCHVIN